MASEVIAVKATHDRCIVTPIRDISEMTVSTSLSTTLAPDRDEISNQSPSRNEEQARCAVLEVAGR